MDMSCTQHVSDLERRNLHAVLEGCPVGAAVVANGRLCFANALFMESTRLAPGAEALDIDFDNVSPDAGLADPGGRRATLLWQVPGDGEYRLRLVAHLAPYGGENAFFLWLPGVADDTARHALLSSPPSEQPAPGLVPASPEAPLAPVEQVAPSAKSRGRILLVEDNEINQEIAVELLELVGVQVDVAANGQEAVDRFLKQDFDLILMDIQMPVMDGMEATRAIRASGAARAETVPILAMTAHGMDSDREKSLQVGMNDHLTKPIDPKRLYSALDIWLPRSSAYAAETQSAPDSMFAPQSAAFAPTSPLQSAMPEERPQQDILGMLQGFDTKAGLSNVAGNRDLYLRLLDRFANNYSNSGMELRDALKRMEHDAAAHEEAVRLAHTAKGVAANLGAHTLAAIAGELESAIKKHRVREEMLARYDLLLREALGAIDTLPKRDDARVGQKAISAADKEYIAAVLDTLPVLMEMDWYGAQQKLQALAPLLEDTAVSAHFREITMALEEFDSASVAEKGKRLLAAI